MTKVYCTGSSVVTPIGSSVIEVLEAVCSGRSAISLHEGWGEPFCASLFDKNGVDGPSFLVQIGVEAARKAFSMDSGVNPASPRTGIIVSTIKGEIEKIGREDVSPAVTAQKIASELGVISTPFVTSNACISGMAAMIQGMRMIRAGVFDDVIVIGAEVMSRFFVTGFQCLKALSPNPCRPFDAGREGLNLGEAASAVILSKRPSAWELVDGAIRNDANHISGPSRTGEGSFQALSRVLPLVDKSDIAFVSVHGTATLYNDEMESIALHRAGLDDVPICAMKGTFGHTMGAAGVLETVLSMAALDEGIVPPSRGFSEMGVTYPLGISAEERPAKGNSIIKLLSGFGGVNGAMLLRKGGMQ